MMVSWFPRPGVEDRGEAAMDPSIVVVGHHVGIHARIGYHLLPAFVTSLLRRPFDPGIDDSFVVRRLHRPLVVGDLAVGDVIAPGFDDAGGAEFPDHGSLLR